MQRRYLAAAVAERFPGFGAADCEIVHALFVPNAGVGMDEESGAYLVDAEAVMGVLR